MSIRKDYTEEFLFQFTSYARPSMPNRRLKRRLIMTPAQQRHAEY